MDKSTDTVISKFQKLAKEKFRGIDRVYLFGSYAKGVQTKDSDIDLAIVFDNLDDSDRFDIQVALMLLASEIDSRIEPHPFSKKDFLSQNPFVVEIKATGKDISQ